MRWDQLAKEEVIKGPLQQAGAKGAIMVLMGPGEAAAGTHSNDILSCLAELRDQEVCSYRLV